MKASHQLALLAVFLLLWEGLFAQEMPKTSAPGGGREWSFNVVTDGYIVPNDQSYASPTFAADRKWLHLEARYNYENLRTGSVWMGYNFSAGKKLVLDVTPIIGGVFGRTTGIAPGCEVSLAYRKVELSISNEYVFDTGDSSGNFYYSWPQLTYSPADWLHRPILPSYLNLTCVIGMIILVSQQCSPLSLRRALRIPPNVPLKLRTVRGDESVRPWNVRSNAAGGMSFPALFRNSRQRRPGILRSADLTGANLSARPRRGQGENHQGHRIPVSAKPLRMAPGSDRPGNTQNHSDCAADQRVPHGCMRRKPRRQITARHSKDSAINRRQHEKLVRCWLPHRIHTLGVQNPVRKNREHHNQDETDK
jgi:hypothetical protein